jgi:hypothetical protein
MEYAAPYIKNSFDDRPQRPARLRQLHSPSPALLSRYAAAADTTGAPPPAAADHFETAEVKTDDNTIFVSPASIHQPGAS